MDSRASDREKTDVASLGQEPGHTRTVVLDDDPTGSQFATEVPVVLDPTPETLEQVLARYPAVYVVTNTRSLSADRAATLLDEIKVGVEAVCKHLSVAPVWVLRGDSTLRGHIAVETRVFASASDLVLFVPAFPDAGRITLDGIHYLEDELGRRPTHETEYAADPEFGYRSSKLVEFIADKTGDLALRIPLVQVRRGVQTVLDILLSAPPGSWIIPDIASNEDLITIHSAHQRALQAGLEIIIRGAAPIAALVAGVASTSQLMAPPTELSAQERRGTLVVCGSHTSGAARQLETAAALFDESVVVNTRDAIHDPDGEAARLSPLVAEVLRGGGTALLATERQRLVQYTSLDDGERVMRCLTQVVARVADIADSVVSKGGITSAEVARSGLGSRWAMVRGQIETGVSLWAIARGDRSIPYVVVPGNIGNDGTIARAIEFVRPGR